MQSHTTMGWKLLMSSSGMYGGAIHVTGAASTLTLNNTDFSGNTTPAWGGAIYMTGSTAATPLSITGGTFTNNTASLEGGGLRR